MPYENDMRLYIDQAEDILKHYVQSEPEILTEHSSDLHAQDETYYPSNRELLEKLEKLANRWGSLMEDSTNTNYRRGRETAFMEAAEELKLLIEQYQEGEDFE